MSHPHPHQKERAVDDLRPPPKSFLPALASGFDLQASSFGFGLQASSFGFGLQAFLQVLTAFEVAHPLMVPSSTVDMEKGHDNHNQEMGAIHNAKTLVPVDLNEENRMDHNHMHEREDVVPCRTVENLVPLGVLEHARDELPDP